MDDEKVEKVEKVPPKRKAPDIPITILQTDARACLVQWIDGGIERRCILPAEFAGGPELSLELLKSGIPYGIPWRMILKPAVTVDRLEESLHSAGIWTFDDLQNHPDWALAALQSAYSIDLGQLLVAALEFIRQKEA